LLFSIVIPLYNEELIVKSSLKELVEKIRVSFPGENWEILLVENGSTDKTSIIIDELQNTIPEVYAFHLPAPDYGAALKFGILKARGEFVISDEIDLGDVSFYEKALLFLRDDTIDMVIGSKVIRGAGDERPVIRKIATRGINLLLRIILGFKGSDTHGLKMFRRTVLLPIVEQCIITKDLFASELVIRSERSKIKILEIPISLHEKRPPAINLTKRIPNVLKGLWILYKTLGIR